MNLILTGASGNLGQHITKEAQFQVLPITKSNWIEFENISTASYDGIIHCAYDLKNNIHEAPDLLIQSNIESTAKALRICKEKNIPKFIFISSCSVYGDSSNSSEEKPCSPVTINGYTKQYNEELIKSFCEANNINYLILRPFNSYGGADNFSVVQKLIKCAKNRVPFTLLNDGIAERDFIHIEDLAKIICQLVTLNLTKEIINIGSGNSVKIIDLISAVEKKYGKIDIVKKTNINEAVYSRANLKKLNGLVNFKCRDIFDYITNFSI
jgi:UDP-glucose 4-epimerase